MNTVDGVKLGQRVHVLVDHCPVVVCEQGGERRDDQPAWVNDLGQVWTRSCHLWMAPGPQEVIELRG